MHSGDEIDFTVLNTGGTQPDSYALEQQKSTSDLSSADGYISEVMVAWSRVAPEVMLLPRAGDVRPPRDGSKLPASSRRSDHRPILRQTSHMLSSSNDALTQCGME
jgi:hypothetical protein